MFVPVFPERLAFGPRGAEEVFVAVVLMTAVCSAVGYVLTRKAPLLQTRILLRLLPMLQLRDEVWEETMPCKSVSTEEAAEEGSSVQQRKMQLRKRTAAELLFIVLHNGAVTALAGAAWILGSPTLALYAFSLEVAYELFDSWSLGMARMEPETFIHHIVSPICILCSTQTDVDFRVLCHLCICIDFSGSLLGLAKFLLRFSHLSASLIYQRLYIVYLFLRVVFPLIDTAIIVGREVYTKGGLFSRLQLQDGSEGPFSRTDWTQLYFWAMAVLNAFNIYFCLIIRARARLPAQVVARQEARMGACN